MNKVIKSFVENIKYRLTNSGGAKRYKWMKIGVYLAVGLLVFGIAYNTFFDNKKWESKVNGYTIEEKEENEINLGISPIRTLNPIVSNDEDVRWITPLLYSSLFKLDESLTPKKDLVESFEFNKGSIKLDLKEATWEDGEHIKGEDIDFTIKAIRYAGENSIYAKSISKIQSVTYKDKEVEINFKDDEDVSLHYLLFPILPKHKYKSPYSLKEVKEDFQPFGSGMFKCESYDKNKGLQLSPNEKYFGSKAKSSISISILADDESKYNFVESGSISLLLTKDEDRSGKVTKKGVKIANFTSNQMEFLSFNLSSKKLENKNLRKAITYCVDTENIVEEDYYNSAKENRGLFLNGYMGLKRSKKDSFDLDKARKFFKKAGYEDKDENGKVENRDEEQLSISFLVDENNKNRKGAVDKIKNSLESIGVDVKLEFVDLETLMGKIKSQDYDIAYVGMSFDETLDYKSLLETGGKNNISSYSNKKIDKLFKSIYSGKTNENIKKDIKEIVNIIEEDTPYYCICYKTYGIVKAPTFSGEIKSTFLEPYMKADTWYSIYKKRVEDK